MGGYTICHSRRPGSDREPLNINIVLERNGNAIERCAFQELVRLTEMHFGIPATDEAVELCQIRLSAECSPPNFSGRKCIIT
ncbi:hypothetical protein B0G57_14213 [Trinickia symbiotica]|nr:hypothetical protein B0G57_14213 [Trinickia symbiotica]